MNTIIKKAIYGLAVMAAVFASCKQKSGDSSALKENNETAKRLVNCLTNTNTITGNSVLIANLGTYSSWGTVSFTFPSSGPSLTWEGQFNSFIRPATTDWYIGIADLADTCDNWATLRTKIVVKNATGNYGTSPASPKNVVGVNGSTVTPAATYNLGYYNYNESTNVATINKIVVIWKVTGLGITWPTSDTSPNLASATVAYIINPKSITPVPLGGTPPTNYRGDVVFRWKKVL